MERRKTYDYIGRGRPRTTAGCSSPDLFLGPANRGSGDRTLKTFDIDKFISALKKSYRTWDAPVITMISSKGGPPFEILISTLLSLRTKDQVTAAASARLFKEARTPSGILALSEERIERLIYPAGFYHTKAKRLREISRILIERFDSRVPDSMEELLSLPGVGRKTANLVLVEGFGKDAICVDTHVHRISNRVGYVSTTGPDKTEFALRDKLPVKYWRGYNEMLVAFGQTLCRPISPFCSKCPVSDMCPGIGVERRR